MTKFEKIYELNEICFDLRDTTKKVKRVKDAYIEYLESLLINHVEVEEDEIMSLFEAHFKVFYDLININDYTMLKSKQMLHFYENTTTSRNLLEASEKMTNQTYLYNLFEDKETNIKYIYVIED